MKKFIGMVLLTFPLLSIVAEGKLTLLIGQVKVHEGKKTLKAAPGMLLKEGDTITTSAKAKAGILMADGASFLLGPNTSFEIKKNSAYMQNAGASSMIFKGQRGASKWEIKTPVTTAAVRGTEFTITNDARRTRLVLFEGKVIMKDFVRETGLPSDANELMQDFLTDVEINAGTAFTFDGDAVKKEKIDLTKDASTSLHKEHLALKSNAKPLVSEKGWKEKAEKLRIAE